MRGRWALSALEITQKDKLLNRLTPLSPPQFMRLDCSDIPAPLRGCQPFVRLNRGFPVVTPGYSPGVPAGT